jgi:hypothetical protein
MIHERNEAFGRIKTGRGTGVFGINLPQCSESTINNI